MERPEAPDSGTRVVSSGRVRDSGMKVKVSIPGHDLGGAPTVELVREAGIVRAIDVTCSCGHRFRLVCEYDGAEGG